MVLPLSFAITAPTNDTQKQAMSKININIEEDKYFKLDLKGSMRIVIITKIVIIIAP